MIKAIDTHYGGHLFRSRLEARYAVYFDNLNVKWEYESEGYELGSGVRYLPDFYLPEYRIFAEAKPIAFNYKEHSKCKRLAVLTQKTVVELVGIPNMYYKNIIVPNQHYVCSKCGKIESYDFDGKRIYCSCKVKHDIVKGINETDAFLLLLPRVEKYVPFYYSTIPDWRTEDIRIRKAVEISTKARFEFK